MRPPMYRPKNCTPKPHRGAVEFQNRKGRRHLDGKKRIKTPLARSGDGVTIDYGQEIGFEISNLRQIDR
ncbi:hypothetical protein [Fulvimarina sp. MAC8]|uniref:hypothetical protein n=1 Tax=Fulvimarina sp. MAC8 TaxID=3162874 RepID=UPI0032EDF790